MVVQGKFSLQLVDAESRQLLKEYLGPSGTVHYAEAKPNGEYFLRFQVLNDDANAKVDQPTDRSELAANEIMYFRPSVDGKDLGFYTNLTQEQGARDVGLWTYIDGIGTNQALKFEAVANTMQPPVTVLASANNADGDETMNTDSKFQGPPKLFMGNVQVHVSRAVFTGNQKRVHISLPYLTKEETVIAPAAVSISASSSLHEDETGPGTSLTLALGSPTDSRSSVGDHGHNLPKTNSMECVGTANQDEVPILRSKEGSHRFQEEVTQECPTYQPGELLETLTIHYGSKAALAHAGILEFDHVPAVPSEFVPMQSVEGATKSVRCPTLLPSANTANESAKAPTLSTADLVPNPLSSVHPERADSKAKSTCTVADTSVVKHTLSETAKLENQSRSAPPVKKARGAINSTTRDPMTATTEI